MAQFARRRIQEAIDVCGGAMPRHALERLVKELNAKKASALSAEWEIMIVAALARRCPVEYEPDLGGERRGDLLVRPGGDGSPGCLVEITTISDEDAHKRNPYEEMSSAIRRKLQKLGCPDRSYSIEVEGDTQGDFGNARMQLYLGTGRAEDLFGDAFHDFVRCIKADPKTSREHRWKGPGLDMKVVFRPGERFHSGRHLSYTTPYSPRKNPLYRALTKKREQLAKTGHDGPCGVVVCDGACHLLTDTLGASGGAASLHEIMHEHFRGSQRLSFVLVLHADLTPPSMLNGMRRERHLKAAGFLRTNACGLARDTLATLKMLPELLPRPILTGDNAARCYRHRWENDPRYGRHGTMSMTERSLKISARAILDILAGDETPERFFQGSSDRLSSVNQFQAQKTRGHLIKSIHFIKGEDDDDLIEFRFGEPDPAVSELRLPPNEPQQPE